MPTSQELRDRVLTYDVCRNCGKATRYSPDDVVELHVDGGYFCDATKRTHADPRGLRPARRIVDEDAAFGGAVAQLLADG